MVVLVMTSDEPLIALASLTREWESLGRSSSRQRKNHFIISNMSEVTRYQTLEVYGIQNDIRSKSQHTENKLNFVELHSTKRSDLVFFRVEGSPLVIKSIKQLSLSKLPLHYTDVKDFSLHDKFSSEVRMQTE